MVGAQAASSLRDLEVMVSQRIRVRNTRLQMLLDEAGWTHDTVARKVNALGAETGLGLRYDRSAVSHWMGGTRPQDPVPALIAEALTRRLGRTITPGDMDYLSRHADPCPSLPADPVARLAELSHADLDPVGHAGLRRSVYRLSALPLLDRPAGRVPAPDTTLSAESAPHLLAARHMLEVFATADHRYGSGHARAALIAYLAHDLAPHLHTAAPDTPRRGLFTAAAELAYLAGFRCFDSLEHGLAQRYYLTALALATRAGDPVRYAVILGGLSQQARYLGHYRHALTLATTALALTGGAAPPHTEAFLHLQAALGDAALGHREAALVHHHRAQQHMRHATGPAPVTGSCHPGELAYQTAQIRTRLGETNRAVTALHTALRHYPTVYHRSRALALVSLLQLHLDTGHHTSARTVWHRVSDYAHVRSARTCTALTAISTRLGGHG